MSATNSPSGVSGWQPTPTVRAEEDTIMKANSSLAARLALMLCVLGLSFLFARQVLADNTTQQRATSSQSSPAGGIKNIADFLNQCPNNDPIYAQLRSDITLRRNGVLVGEVPCIEPISQLPVAQYTDELIYLQTLRTIYYMDLGRSGYLPWTSGTLYDWMTSKIGGINLSDTAAGSYCCTQIGGKTYIVIKTQDEYNRNFDRQWKGISGNLGLVMHEVRHTDGFPHNSGCGISNGCDAAYDEANLSPYGIQWWLAKNWLMGDIYVGYSCNTPAVVNDIAYWHFSGANSQFRNRFTSNPPPLLTMPQSPGGICPVDLTKLNWAALPLSPSAGQTVTFSMHLHNMGGSASVTLMTATLPSHTTYVSGSAATSQGTVSGSDPLVFNLGTVTYNSPLTITFAVLIDSGIASPTAAIGQTAITWTGGGRSFNYGVIINPLVSYLALIIR